MPDPAASPLDRQLPIAHGRAVAAWLWSALRGRRLRLAGILLLFLAEAAATLVFPLVLGSLIDAVLAGSGGEVPAVFWWQLAALLAAALLSGMLAWAGGTALAGVAETVIAELREEYVSAALGLPRDEVEAAGTGDVVTRASDDIAHVSETLPHVLPQLAVSIFTITLVAAGLGALNPWFLACFAVAVPIYALTVRWYLRTAPPVYETDRAAASARGQRILGTLGQLPTVAAHRLEQRSLRRIEAATWAKVRSAMRTRIIQNRLFGRLNLAEAVGLFAVLGAGVWLAAAGVVSPGGATTAALLFLRTVAPIATLLRLMDDLQSALASLGRIIGVIGYRDRAEPGARKAAAPLRPAEAVSFREVDFSYRPGVPVLRAVDLVLRSGETAAVVGATGSGKSTLAALLAGIHVPERGRIGFAVPREEIVTVTQETHVFAASLRENLTLAAPDADDGRLEAAMRSVGAGALLGDLPSGLDTPLGHGGHELTAAQAQHLALARIVLADPAVVVLDEATAEADTRDSSALDAAAAEAIRDRTALVIAHRLGQAATADRIIVLERGRIIESGTHEELRTAGGLYRSLWDAWSRGRRPTGP